MLWKNLKPKLLQLLKNCWIGAKGVLHQRKLYITGSLNYVSDANSCRCDFGGLDSGQEESSPTPALLCKNEFCNCFLDAYHFLQPGFSWHNLIFWLSCIITKICICRKVSLKNYNDILCGFQFICYYDIKFNVNIYEYLSRVLLLDLLIKKTLYFVIFIHLNSKSCPPELVRCKSVDVR